jgi:Bacterial regulatory proteins, tetR family
VEHTRAEAADNLLVERGFAGVTMETVATRAGVAQQTSSSAAKLAGHAGVVWGAPRCWGWRCPRCTLGRARA